MIVTLLPNGAATNLCHCPSDMCVTYNKFIYPVHTALSTCLGAGCNTVKATITYV